MENIFWGRMVILFMRWGYRKVFGLGEKKIFWGVVAK